MHSMPADPDQVPLVTLLYRGEDLWVCPHHITVLIHEPESLSDILPGAEEMTGAEHHPDCDH